MQLRAIRWIPKTDRSDCALDRRRKKGCKAEAMRDGIYDHPHAYDVAFSYRNVREETDFLSEIMEKHGRSDAFEDFLEIGCGPAKHCMELDRRGKRCFGLDSNPNMVQYAREKVHQEGLERTRIEECDMRLFDIDRSFDLICCLLGTLSHLHTQEDLVSTFQRCAKHNKAGGLFVVEIAHPADLFDGSLMDQQGDAWEAEEGGLHIVVEWGREGDYFCPTTQIMERTVGLSALTEGGELMYSVQEVVSQRQFTLPEIRSLAMLVGYEYVGAYGEMNPSLQVLPDAEDACRLVIILRKK